jgi:hypothetical protein
MKKIKLISLVLSLLLVCVNHQIKADSESITMIYSGILLHNFEADPCGESYAKKIMDAVRATQKVVNAYAITVSENEIEIKKQLTANISHILYKWRVIKNDSEIQFTAFDPDKNLSITSKLFDDLMNSLIEEGSLLLADYIRYLLIQNEYIKGKESYIKSSRCQTADHELNILLNTKHPTQLLALLKSKQNGFDDVVSIESNIDQLSKIKNASGMLFEDLQEAVATEEQRAKVSGLKEKFKKMFERAEQSHENTKHFKEFLILRKVEKNPGQKRLFERPF